MYYVNPFQPATSTAIHLTMDQQHHQKRHRMQVDQAGQQNSHAESGESQSNAQPFRFEDLPVEVQLQVVQRIPTDPELLQLRLVSSGIDALVLEPVFWCEIAFSKRLCFKAGHGPRSHRTAMGTSSTDRGSSIGSLFYHNSDANIMVHRQSWAASMMQHPTVRDMISPTEPSLTITANMPGILHSGPLRLASERTHPSAPLEGLSPSWSSIEDSFLMFISRLSSRARAAHGIHRISVEDWEGEATMAPLWIAFQAFDTLTDLSIRNSVLKELKPATLSSDVCAPACYWEQLTRLDLTGCRQLCNLSGILQWMPHLQDLSLVECSELLDFTPLTRPGPTDDSNRDLEYRRINLTQTKIHDAELIELLKRSPHLQELRLDQCYELTDASIVTIGRGSQESAASTLTSIPEGPIAGKSQADADMMVNDQDQDQSKTVSTSSYCPALKVLSLKNCYDLGEEGVRALAGCRQLELLIVRGLRGVNEQTIEWLHAQGVPLRKALSPLGQWRHWSF